MGKSRLLLALVALLVLVALLLRLGPVADDATTGGGDLLGPAADRGVDHPFAMAELASDAVARPSELASPAVPANGSDAPWLDVSLRHADGSPAAGCRAVLARGEDVAWRGWTDDAGRLQSPGLDGAATLWIGGAGSHPLGFELPEAAGTHQLVLPDGRTVDGRVIFADPRPSEPLALALESDEDEPEPPRGIRVALRDPQPGFHDGWAHNAQRLAADGGFRFSGLPPGWSGQLVPPAGWSLADRLSWDVEAPARGLELVLHRDAVVRLRVLQPAGEPAAGASVGVTLHGRTNSQSFGLMADDQGRAAFALPAPRGAWRAELILAHDASRAQRRLTLDWLEATRDTDLGDVFLENTRTIVFRVRDTAGKPLAGAKVATEGAPRVTSPATAEDGRGELSSVPPACTGLLAAAPRHLPSRVALPAAPPEAPLEIALQACAWLVVDVSSGSSSLEGLDLVVSRDVEAAGEDQAFFGLPGQAGEAAVRMLAAPSAGPDGHQVRRQSDLFHLQAPPRIEVGCVDAERPVHVVVREATGHVVARAPAVTLAPGEERIVALRVDSVPRAVEVLVTDPAGVPVEGAELGLQAPPAAGEEEWFVTMSLRTDARGRAVSAPLHAPAVVLECTRAGFAPVRREGVVPGVPEHVVLDVGHEVTLRCVGPAGEPLPAWPRSVERRDGTHLDVDVTPLDPPRDDGSPAASAWRLEHLPAGVFVLRVQAGGREFALEHDARVPEARLVLPEAGRLAVEWPVPLPASPTGHPVLSVRDAAGHELRHTLTPGQQDQPGGVLLDVVFPGSHEVRLLRRQPDGTEADVLPAVRVDVTAGTTARAVLR